MYTINYHTGAGNEDGFATIEEAMDAADHDAAYTQRDITIEDADGNEVARRHWYGVEYDEDNSDSSSPICFGDYGHYADWS